MADFPLIDGLTSRLIKKYDEETSELLNVLLNIIESFQDKKASDQFRSNVMGIVFKVVLLYKQKHLTKEAFNSLKYSFRFVCSSTTNAYRNLHGKFDQKTVERIQKYIDRFKNELITILQPLDKKVVDKVEEAVTFAGSAPFLMFASKSPQFKNVVFVLVSYLARTK